MPSELKLPPLALQPMPSWYIDDDGAQHPFMAEPQFSTKEVVQDRAAVLRAVAETCDARAKKCRDGSTGQAELAAMRDELRAAADKITQPRD